MPDVIITPLELEQVSEYTQIERGEDRGRVRRSDRLSLPKLKKFREKGCY